MVDVAEKLLNITVEERPVRFDEVHNFVECGMCGTAAVISPVGEVQNGEETIVFGAGMKEVGPVMKLLRKTLTDIQSSEREDTFGWVHEITLEV